MSSCDRRGWTTASGWRRGCTDAHASYARVGFWMFLSFGLVLGAGAALGCGRDGETGGFYLHREMRLIWYVLHNTIIDMLIVLPLLAGLQWRRWDGAVLLSLTCSNQSLLTSGWTKVHDRFGQLSQSCVRLPFSLCFSLLIPEENM